MDIDPAQLLNAVDRSLTTVEREGAPAKLLTASRTYPAGIDDVWDALTDAERIPRWFLPISGELQVGRRFQLEGNAGGEVLECEQPQHLSITWEFGGAVSWVEVTLTEVGSATRLQLHHTAPVDPEQWAEYGPGAVGVGWEGALMGLELHLSAGGAAVDPAEAAAWMGTPDGISFITGASNAWADAAILAGDDPDQAREAAQRCTAAYTPPPTGS